MKKIVKLPGSPIRLTLTYTERPKRGKHVNNMGKLYAQRYGTSKKISMIVGLKLHTRLIQLFRSNAQNLPLWLDHELENAY